MPDFPDLPAVDDLTGEADERHEHRFSRVVAVAIVLATLAAAATAYLQAAARRTSDDAASRSTQLAAAGLAARNLSDQAAFMLVDRYDLAEQELTRAGQAEQQAVFGPAATRAQMEAERARWDAVAAQAARNTTSLAASYGLAPITTYGEYGPVLDPGFPEQYLGASRRTAYLMGAQRDAADQQGAQADSQVARSAIALTIIAVSVFLFGYSLTPYARSGRLIFATVAGALLIGGATWAAVIAAQAPRLAPAQASSAFADGSVAYYSGQYQLAVRDFTRSIQPWPEDAQAYNLRARADFAAGSPQLDIAPSLTTEAALSAAAADDQRAIDLGDDDSGLITTAGYNLFALGLRRNDAGVMERGLGYSELGMTARPTDPIPAYNVAVTLLALGRLAQARAAYRQAVDRTIYSDVARHVHRNDTTIEEEDLAAALTDIASVQARRGPELRRQIDQIEADVVAPITRDSYAESPYGRVRSVAAASGLSLAVGPASAAFTILKPHHLDVNRDDLSVQWYAEASGGLGWNALPDVSGAFSQGLNGSQETAGGGVIRDIKSYLSAAGACLQPTAYRADLYDNGRLIAETTRHVRFPELVAAHLPDIGVEFCRPSQWKPITDRAPSLFDGYTSPDHRAGMIVVAVNSKVLGAARPSSALIRRVLATTLANFAGSLPTGLHQTGETSQPFMGLGTGLVKPYRYPGGSALAGAVESSGGEIFAAVTYGPSTFLATSGRAIFGSLAPAQ
jgi:hypothetical protein